MTVQSASQDANTTKRPRRLGRGLASLMANTKLAAPEDVAPSAGPGRYEPVAAPAAADAAPKGGVMTIPTEAIQPNPYQPRRTFDAESLAELADSIRRQGLLQPLLVVEREGGYVVVAGERRLRAAKAAGLTEVPCVLREATREQMLQWALTENLQRSDLNVVDRAVAYRDYMDQFSVTQQQLAEQLSLPRPTISNTLRMLDLCDRVQAMLAAGALSFGHGKVLAGLAGRVDEQTALATRIVEGGLSVRHLEQLVAQAVNGESDQLSDVAAAVPVPGKSAKTQHILDLERQLTRAVGTKVTIRPSRAKHKGRITLEYYSLDDFDRIVEALGATLEA